MVSAANKVVGDAMAVGNVIQSALQGPAPFTVTFPNSGLGSQLNQVARLIAARTALGMSRQIFFCSQGGYDSHAGQLPTHVGLFGQLAAAMSAFDTATQELGAGSQVTTFLESDFGRTFQPNSNIGTDHAWTSHFVATGGAVKGGEVYGEFPSYVLGGDDDVTDRGVFIPRYALDQYGATLASWFGVGSGALDLVFPNLKNFSVRNLGFIA